MNVGYPEDAISVIFDVVIIWDVELNVFLGGGIVKYFTSKSKVTFARLAVADVLTPFPKSRI